MKSPKSFEDEAREVLKFDNPELQDVYDIYKKWLHVEDTKRIDLGLAVALTRKFEGTPIWLIIVAPSGDWKSEQINALYDPETTIKLDRLTSKTIISGSPKVKDLAPELKDKLILFSDFAAMLKAHPQEKAEVFAQLRELYDGRAGGAYGTGKKSHYEGIRTTWIIGSTPAIDRQILIHQDLGTRELIYRPIQNKKSVQNIRMKIYENRYVRDKMKFELNKITRQFLRNTEIKKFELDPEVLDVIYKLVDYICVMRANAATDSFSGELISDVDMERPTRVLQQFFLLYEALKSLRPDYPDGRACEILKEVAFGSGNRHRMKVFSYLKLMEGGRLSTHNISSSLKMGHKTVYSELFALWNMGIVNREREEVGYKYVDYWDLNMEDKLTKDLLKIDDSLLLLLN